MLKELSSGLKKTLSSEKTGFSPDGLRAIEKKLACGSSGVARAVSDMIGVKVSIAGCSLGAAALSDVPRQLNAYDESVVMIYNRVGGAHAGLVIVYAPIKELIRISEIFLHKGIGYFDSITDENLSVIKEFSRIIADYYITVLNDVSCREYSISAPSLSAGLYKMAEKIKEHISEKPVGSGAEFVVFGTEFSIGDGAMKLATLLLLSAEDAREIFGAGVVR